MPLRVMVVALWCDNDRSLSAGGVAEVGAGGRGPVALFIANNISIRALLYGCVLLIGIWLATVPW